MMTTNEVNTDAPKRCSNILSCCSCSSALAGMRKIGRLESTVRVGMTEFPPVEILEFESFDVDFAG